MPVKRTTKNSKPAYKWGDQGKAYTYTAGNKSSRERAKSKAREQAKAARASGYRG